MRNNRCSEERERVLSCDGLIRDAAAVQMWLACFPSRLTDHLVSVHDCFLNALHHDSSDGFALTMPPSDRFMVLQTCICARRQVAGYADCLATCGHCATPADTLLFTSLRLHCAILTSSAWRTDFRSNLNHLLTPYYQSLELRADARTIRVSNLYPLSTIEHGQRLNSTL
jgi:hypothetical protein